METISIPNKYLWSSQETQDGRIKQCPRNRSRMRRYSTARWASASGRKAIAFHYQKYIQYLLVSLVFAFITWRLTEYAKCVKQMKSSTGIGAQLHKSATPIVRKLSMKFRKWMHNHSMEVCLETIPEDPSLEDNAEFEGQSNRLEEVESSNSDFSHESDDANDHEGGMDLEAVFDNDADEAWKGLQNFFHTSSVQNVTASRSWLTVQRAQFLSLLMGIISFLALLAAFGFPLLFMYSFQPSSKPENNELLTQIQLVFVECVFVNLALFFTLLAVYLYKTSFRIAARGRARRDGLLS